MYWINKPLFPLFRWNQRAVTEGWQLLQGTRSLKTKTEFGCPLTTISDERRSGSQPLPFHSLPGPTIIESLTTIWREGIENYHHIIADGFEKYGPIFKFNMPDNLPWVCISDPHDVEQLFRADKFPPIRPNVFNSSRYYLEKGLSEGILGNDEHWHRHRSPMSKNLLRPVEIQHFASSLCEISDDYIAFLKDGRNEDLLHHFHKWSTESIALVTFGCRVGVNLEYPDEKALSFIDAACDFLEIEAQLFLSLPIHKFFKTPALKRLFCAMDTIWNVTTSYVEKASNKPMSLQKGKHFVEKVVEDNRHQLSNEEIVQTAINLFLGGVDTTSVSLVNVLYHLSNFPEVQEKLHKEIQHVLPNDEKPTGKDLANMPYLKAVVKESLRVTPTALGTTRQIREPIVLGGYEIPEKTTIFMSLNRSKAMQKRIFGDFQNFKPERWLQESTTPHPFASLPFGFGVRMCVGRRVAEMEIFLFLVRFLQRFEIQPSDLEEDKLESKFHMVIVPSKPFNLNLKKRA